MKQLVKKGSNLNWASATSKPPFLQPAPLALVSFAFISLLLIMDLMDLRRIENRLNHFLEDQALRIIKDVGRTPRDSLCIFWRYALVFSWTTK